MRPMPRGVVLRPNLDGCATLRSLWELLAEAGLPSVAGHRKAVNEPHLSLTVGDQLDVGEVLSGLERAALLPRDTVAFEAVSTFPGGVLFLAAVPDLRLLQVQATAHRVCIEAGSTSRLWDHYAPGTWTPHVTLGYGYTPSQIGRAAELLLPLLPLSLTGWTAWLEDGNTGEAWPIP
ncbi:MAG: hypothetical protein JWM02_1236 [Frankiales bacterium]|nr:hypothetical protein [Frankiales bacterium]